MEKTLTDPTPMKQFAWRARHRLVFVVHLLRKVEDASDVHHTGCTGRFEVQPTIEPGGHNLI